jgi:hypothetical protein
MNITKKNHVARQKCPPKPALDFFKSKVKYIILLHKKYVKTMKPLFCKINIFKLLRIPISFYYADK